MHVELHAVVPSCLFPLALIIKPSHVPAYGTGVTLVSSPNALLSVQLFLLTSTGFGRRLAQYPPILQLEICGS